MLPDVDIHSNIPYVAIDKHYPTTLSGAIKGLWDKAFNNDKIYLTPQEAQGRIIDLGGEPSDGHHADYWDPILGAPQRWMSSIHNQTNPLYGINRTILPSAGIALGTNVVSRVPGFIRSIPEIYQANPAAFIGKASNFIDKLGFGMLGGSAVNMASKELTGNTWGENVSNITGLVPFAAEFTNPGYAGGSALAPYARKGLLNTAGKMMQRYKNGTPKRLSAIDSGLYGDVVDSSTGEIITPPIIPDELYQSMAESEMPVLSRQDVQLNHYGVDLTPFLASEIPPVTESVSSPVASNAANTQINGSVNSGTRLIRPIGHIDLDSPNPISTLVMYDNVPSQNANTSVAVDSNVSSESQDGSYVLESMRNAVRERYPNANPYSVDNYISRFAEILSYGNPRINFDAWLNRLDRDAANVYGLDYDYPELRLRMRFGISDNIRNSIRNVDENDLSSFLDNNLTDQLVNIYRDDIPSLVRSMSADYILSHMPDNQIHGMFDSSELPGPPEEVNNLADYNANIHNEYVNLEPVDERVDSFIRDILPSYNDDQIARIESLLSSSNRSSLLKHRDVLDDRGRSIVARNLHDLLYNNVQPEVFDVFHSDDGITALAKSKIDINPDRIEKYGLGNTGSVEADIYSLYPTPYEIIYDHNGDLITEKVPADILQSGEFYDRNGSKIEFIKQHNPVVLSFPGVIDNGYLYSNAYIKNESYTPDEIKNLDWWNHRQPFDITGGALFGATKINENNVTVVDPSHSAETIKKVHSVFDAMNHGQAFGVSSVSRDSYPYELLEFTRHSNDGTVFSKGMKKLNGYAIKNKLKTDEEYLEYINKKLDRLRNDFGVNETQIPKAVIENGKLLVPDIFFRKYQEGGKIYSQSSSTTSQKHEISAKGGAIESAIKNNKSSEILDAIRRIKSGVTN